MHAFFCDFQMSGRKDSIKAQGFPTQSPRQHPNPKLFCMHAVANSEQDIYIYIVGEVYVSM